MVPFGPKFLLRFAAHLFLFPASNNKFDPGAYLNVVTSGGNRVYYL